MESPFIWLVIGEIIVIAFIIIAKIIFEKIEDKKIDKVLQFMNKKTKDDQDTQDKLKECLKIIEHNQDIESR